MKNKEVAEIQIEKFIEKAQKEFKLTDSDLLDFFLRKAIDEHLKIMAKKVL